MKTRFPQISQITQMVSAKAALVGFQGGFRLTPLQRAYLVCVICEIYGVPDVYQSAEKL
jgi:hypothetical protein